jgi:hypothetical protein
VQVAKHEDSNNIVEETSETALSLEIQKQTHPSVIGKEIKSNNCGFS